MTLALLLALLPQQSPPAPPADVDSDGDGLSDFEEIHKYFTDPHNPDTDGDGIPDGDWDERREYAYTVRTIVDVLPPVTDDVLHDDYQDARVLERTPEYVQLEVVHYPLNTVAQAIAGDPEWRTHAAALSAWTAPGRTANWDEAMRQELLSQLKADGIDAAALDDKTLVERASNWLLGRTRNLDAFTTYYAWFPDGRAEVFPGLEQAVAGGRKDLSISLETHWERELFAKGMFENRTRGTCTSSAIYLDGCLRALGIPTRVVLGLPCVDPSDAREIEMVKRGITHPGVRRIVLQALEGQAGSWVNHTLNEVYVGGRWRRLNYDRLGQNILDPVYLGLMTHAATFGDWADGEFAKTWGVRQGKGGPHDDVFGGPNPYSTLSVSDRFGVHAKVAKDLLLGPDEFRVLTIEKAYWWSSPERKVEMDLRGDDPAGHFLVHVREKKEGAGSKPYNAFWGGCPKKFVLRAPAKPDVHARATRGLWADPKKDVREFHLQIEPGELAKMEIDVPYALAPVQSEVANDLEFRWELAGSVTLVRPPGAPPIAGEKILTLVNALWSDELPAGSRGGIGKDDHFLLARVGEPKSFDEVKAFTSGADPGFELLDGGRPVLSLSTGVGGMTMKDGVYLMMPVSREDWSRLPAGTSYTLRPTNQRAGYRWRVDPALKVVRP